MRVTLGMPIIEGLEEIRVSSPLATADFPSWLRAYLIDRIRVHRESRMEG